MTTEKSVCPDCHHTTWWSWEQIQWVHQDTRHANCKEPT